MIAHVSKGSRVIKNSIEEIVAALYAANLYPFGILEKHPKAKKHSKLAHNPRPILLVHGIMHNRSAFYRLKKKMETLGWENIYTLNYPTFHGSLFEMVEHLSNKVNKIKAQTGATQVDLVAHSLGGLVGRAFMTLGPGRGSIGKLITLGTPHQGTQLSFGARMLARGALDKDLKANSYFIQLLNSTGLPPKSTLTSIYSDFDWTVVPYTNGRVNADPMRGVKNLEIKNIGHLGMLFNQKVFDLIIKEILA